MVTNGQYGKKLSKTVRTVKNCQKPSRMVKTKDLSIWSKSFKTVKKLKNSPKRSKRVKNGQYSGNWSKRAEKNSKKNTVKDGKKK